MDIEHKEVPLKLPRMSSLAGYSDPSSKYEKETNLSVMGNTLEHHGQRLIPVLSERTQMKEQLQSEETSPMKTPKISGLKLGCTVLQGSGRQKYLGSFRRNFTQPQQIVPEQKPVHTKPLLNRHMLKPSLKTSVPAPKIFHTTENEDEVETKDDKWLSAKHQSSVDTEDRDSFTYEDLKNTQNTSQESVESSTQDDSEADPSYKPNKSTNISTESSSTGDHSKSTDDREMEQENNEDSESEDEDNDNAEYSENDEYESKPEMHGEQKVNSKQSTVVLVDNLHKSSDQINKPIEKYIEVRLKTTKSQV